MFYVKSKYKLLVFSYLLLSCRKKNHFVINGFEIYVLIIIMIIIAITMMIILIIIMMIIIIIIMIIIIIKIKAMKYLNDSKAFIKYSNDVHDI